MVLVHIGTNQIRGRDRNYEICPKLLYVLIRIFDKIVAQFANQDFSWSKRDQESATRNIKVLKYWKLNIIELKKNYIRIFIKKYRKGILFAEILLKYYVWNWKRRWNKNELKIQWRINLHFLYYKNKTYYNTHYVAHFSFQSTIVRK